MKVRAVRTLAAVFFLLYAVALTWPGMLPFNRIRPFVLGLPFSMFWAAAWIVGGMLVLWIVHRVEGGSDADGPGRRDGGR